MKKILVIQGGGRPKGNTRQLVDAFAQGAMEAGHEVETISLNKIQVNGCLGCNACRYGKPCIQKDGIPQQDRSYIMAFYIQGLMAIISEWLRNDCADSIAYVVDMIQRCVKRRREGI